MNFFDAVRACYGKSFDFAGRASRGEFWWFQLYAIFAAVGSVLVLAYLYESASQIVGVAFSVPWFAFMVSLIIQQLSVGVRRLHDTGLSGWFWLLILVPLGGFVLLVWFILPGADADNKYGPPPLIASQLPSRYA